MATSTLDINQLIDDATAFTGLPAARAPTAPASPPVAPVVPKAPRHPLADPSSQEFLALAKKYDVDPAIMGRLMQRESNFDPRAVSKAGAQGLLQLMPSVQQDYGVVDPFDPAQNVQAGFAYMRDLRRKHKGDYHLALAEWNAGGKALQRYGGIPPYPETQGLIKNVLGTGLGAGEIERLTTEAVGFTGMPASGARASVPSAPREPMPPVVTRPAVSSAPPVTPPPASPVPAPAAPPGVTLRPPAADVPGYPAPAEPVQPGVEMPGPVEGGPGMQQYPAPTGAPPGGGPAMDLQYGLQQGAEIITRQLANAAMIWRKFHNIVDPMGRTAISEGQWPERIEQATRQMHEAVRLDPALLQDRTRFDQVLLRSLGQAVPQLAEMMGLVALGAPATAVYVGTGVLNDADKGVLASLWGALKGYVFGKVATALGGMSPVAQIPTAGILAGAGTYAETRDVQQSLANALVAAGVQTALAGPQLRGSFQRLSDYLDQRLAGRAFRQAYEQDPIGLKSQMMGDAAQAFRRGQSVNDVAGRWQSQYGMLPEQARQAATHAYHAYTDALKQQLQGDRPALPEQAGPSTTGEPRPPTEPVGPGPVPSPSPPTGGAPGGAAARPAPPAYTGTGMSDPLLQRAVDLLRSDPAVRSMVMQWYFNIPPDRARQLYEAASRTIQATPTPPPAPPTSAPPVAPPMAEPSPAADVRTLTREEVVTRLPGVSDAEQQTIATALTHARDLGVADDIARWSGEGMTRIQIAKRLRQARRLPGIGDFDARDLVGHVLTFLHAPPPPVPEGELSPTQQRMVDEALETPPLTPEQEAEAQRILEANEPAPSPVVPERTRVPVAPEPLGPPAPVPVTVYPEGPQQIPIPETPPSPTTTGPVPVDARPAPLPTIGQMLPPAYLPPGPADVVPGALEAPTTSIPGDRDLLPDIRNFLGQRVTDATIANRLQASQGLLDRVRRAIETHAETADPAMQTLVGTLQEYATRLERVRQDLHAQRAQQLATAGQKAAETRKARQEVLAPLPSGEEASDITSDIPVEIPPPEAPGVPPEPLPPSRPVPAPLEEVTGPPVSQSGPSPRLTSGEAQARFEATIGARAAPAEVWRQLTGMFQRVAGRAAEYGYLADLGFDDAQQRSLVDAVHSAVNRGENWYPEPPATPASIEPTPPMPPTPQPSAPQAPPPVPGAKLARSGEVYKTQENADFALAHRSDVTPGTHEVQHREGYGYFIVPKGTAVPKVLRPREAPPVPPTEPEPVEPTPPPSTPLRPTLDRPPRGRQPKGVPPRPAEPPLPPEGGVPEIRDTAERALTEAEPPVPTAEVQPIPPAQAFQRLSAAILLALQRGMPLRTVSDLQKLADEAYGGTRASGAYDTRDLYDAAEVALNTEVRLLGLAGMSGPDESNVQHAQGTANFLSELAAKIPTQTVRTAEQDALQQFSTPLVYAYAAAWVANLQPSDVVLEPSAGTGTLAGMARLVVGEKVHVNEIAERRLEALRQQGYQHITTQDARFLHSLLYGKLDPQPTVILMNPPFSQSALQGRKEPMAGAHHVEQALKLLPEGGRLVAIVGRGMGPETSTYRAWFDKIRRQDNVRAVVEVDGKVYERQGTHFGTRLIVIDRGTPTPEGGTLVTSAATIPELLEKLQEIRNVRTNAAPVAPPERVEAAPSSESASEPRPEPARPADAVGVGAQPRPGGGAPAVSPGAGPAGYGPVESGGGGTSAGGAGRPRGERSPAGPGRARAPEPVGGSAAPPAPTPRTTPAVQRELSPSQPPASSQPGQQPVTPPPEATQAPEGEPEVTEADLTQSIFTPYHPQRLQIPGAHPHPGPLVESAAMGATPAPLVNYTHHLPDEVITEGRLSLPQLEAVVYAGQAHDHVLPGGERRGFFIGDGTGVGKGREIAGILYDNWLQGRTKGVWISKNYDLFGPAQRDWVAVTGRDKSEVFTVQKPNRPAGVPLEQEQGILFMPYDTLKNSEKKEGGRSRVEQVVAWLGADFDGVIIWDEAHMMGHNITSKGEAGGFGQQASARAREAERFRKALPNARIVFLSATGATELENMGYLDRLGLWGPGTDFSTKIDFINKMESQGIAGMEALARDMKALGMYMARSLSYHGVRYDRLEKPFTEADEAMYNRIAFTWQKVTEYIEAALKATGSGTMSTLQRKSAESAFWGAQQRFFNQLLTSLKTPTMIAHIETYIHDPDGGAAVIQLTNTNDATAKRRLAQLEDDDSLEDLTLSPMDILMDYIQSSFPTAQQVTRMEGEHLITETLMDDEGRPVQNPDAVQLRDNLINEMATLQADIPNGPLEQLLDHFGPENVTEITGRNQRLVYRENAQGKRERIRETGRTDRIRMQDHKDFNDDKKRILVFSGKGDTGMDYHAGREFKNQRQRHHYVLQPGWQADRTVQGMGRSHRTNEASTPIYYLVTTDLPAELRFISSIARRLDQLGALTRGQRQASSNGLFNERDNLENQYARDALYRYLIDVDIGRNTALARDDFEKATGLDPSEARDITIQRFLNRLFMFPVSVQRQVFAEFSARLDSVIERAIQEGKFNVGMETLQADRITKIREQPLATDTETGAETRYVELKMEKKPRPLTWENVSARLAKRQERTLGMSGKPLGYATNNQSGRVYLMTTEIADVDPKTGGQIPLVRRFGPMTEDSLFQHDVTKEKYTTVTEDEAKALWEAEIAKLPEYLAHREHLITGVLLPHFSKLPDSAAKVYRLQTTDGERLLGRTIPPSRLEKTLKNFGVSLEGAEIAMPDYSPTEIMRLVLGQGYDIRLSNDWRLRRSRVGGVGRVELLGLTSAEGRNLEALGGIMERIGYTAHWYLPTSDEGADILGRLMQHQRVVEATPPHGG